MHLRDDTTNAFGFFRKCSGFDQAKLRRRNLCAEVKMLSLVERSRAVVGRLASGEITKDVELPLLRLDRASGCVQMLHTW